LAKRLRFVLLLPVVVALFGASVASAATVRPAIDPGVNWTPLSRSFSPSDAPFVCGRNGALCYLPQDIQQAYDFPSGPGAPTGAGQTILIATAYGAPYMQPLLQFFDAVLGIPDPPSFEIYNQQQPAPGSQGGSGFTFTWQIETALDVEWAHAMAPGAKIVLAVAKSDDTQDLMQVLKEAIPRYPGAIVSQSFGADETGPMADPTAVPTLEPLYLLSIIRGGTVLAAAGDFGASNGTELEGIQPSVMAAYPASDPLVLSVGGTMGNPGPDSLWQPGGYGGEQVWNEIFNGRLGATGGAPSTLFDAPPWQRPVTKSQDRQEPDVSYNAALNGGYLVAIAGNTSDGGMTVDMTKCNPFAPLTNAVGGTSAGTPQWASIIALANELRVRQHRGNVGFVSPLLYDIAKNKRAYAQDFHDITVGNNALGQGLSQFGFPADRGYDIPTGLGTPDVTNLIGDLAQAKGGDLPGKLFRGIQIGRAHV